jgi:hypothetical protein
MDKVTYDLEDDDRQKLTDLMVEFAWRVDHGTASSIHELVADDIEMVLTKGTMIGKDAVKSWGIKRDAGDRTTAHLLTNFRFPMVSPERVEVYSTAVIFVHAGVDVGAALPWGVTEYRDVFVRVDGEWKFQSRFSTDVFMSGES